MTGLTPLSLLAELLQPRKLTQTERILRLLKRRGNFGASNRELNSICYRYAARIFELRRDGYLISGERDTAGLYRYILKREPVS
jgi:hypothetical protein